MTREEKLQKAHQMFDNRNLLQELKWQREYFKRGYVSNQEELFNLWIFDECIKALEQEPKWIPVSESLPKAGEYVGDVEKYYLVQNEYGDMMVASYTHSEYWEQIFQTNPIADKIVAWMPLPEPYKR